MDSTENYPPKNEAEPAVIFVVGDEVKVARTVYDSEGKRTDERVIEDGWKVINVEDTVDGTFITTQLVDEVDKSIATKRYSANKLLSIQSQGEAPEIAASKNILGLSELQNDPEREAEIEHIQEEMAEVALEDAEIEDPEEAKPETDTNKQQLEGYLTAARLQYDNLTNFVRESAATELHKGAGRIEDASGMINLANNLTRSLDDDRANLLRVVIGLDNGSYSNESARTLLHNISETLQGTYARLRNVSENTAPDVGRAVASLTESLSEVQFELRHNANSFNQHADELIQKNPDAELTIDTVSPEADIATMKAIEEPIEAIMQAARGVDAEVGENAQTVRIIINQIDEVMRLSYNGRVDVDAIRIMASRLSSAAENSQQLGIFNGTLNEAVSTIHSAAARLSAE